MESVGILCRGQSLELLPQFAGNFDDCFIVNDWRLEYLIFEDHMKGKSIVHFLNADRRSFLGRKIYRQLGITEGVIGWTKNHELPGMGKRSRGKNTVVAAMNKYRKELKMSYLPNSFYQDCENFDSAGLICLLYVSEIIKPKVIWIMGVDFYTTDYLVERRGTYRPLNTEKMVDDFVVIVKRYPEIYYKMVTYHDVFSNLENVEVML